MRFIGGHVRFTPSLLDRCLPLPFMRSGFSVAGDYAYLSGIP